MSRWKDKLPEKSEGKGNPEGSSFVSALNDAEAAVMVGYYLAGNRKAEAGASLLGFRSEKRIEYPVDKFRGNAGSCIRDIHDHGFCSVSRLYVEGTAVLHRVEGVSDNGKKDLPQFSFVALYRRHLCPEVFYHPDVLQPALKADDLQGLVQ